MVTQDILRTHEGKLCFYFKEEKNHRISDRLKTLLDLRFEKKAQIRICIRLKSLDPDLGTIKSPDPELGPIKNSDPEPSKNTVISISVRRLTTHGQASIA